MSHSYKLPLVDMHLPQYGTAAAMDAVEKDMWRWLEGHRLIGNEAKRERLVRTRPQYTTALYFPYADEDRLIVINRFMALAFLVDDIDDEHGVHDDDAVSEFCENLIAIAYRTRAPSSGVERAVAEVMGDLSAGRSSAWHDALNESFAQWLRTYPVEVRLARLGEAMPFQEYVPHRRYSVGEIGFLHMHEYVQGIDLPAHVRNLPAMTEARNRASEWIGLYNDVYSLEKEEAVGYPHNAVLVVRRQRGRGTQDAVDVVNGILSGLLDQFEAACHAIPGQVRAVVDDSCIVDDAMRIVDGYRQILRGNFDYHIGTPRYLTGYVQLQQVS
ncbi:terpene synthase family protein [Streptomyces sp. YGL11-2]|uniref:terpene synthase family protein n=1 Tax=Streptomyces sp. YGL11-2 TaxID=3414028 RepID=UPI003CEE21B6